MGADFVCVCLEYPKLNENRIKKLNKIISDLTLDDFENTEDIFEEINNVEEIQDALNFEKKILYDIIKNFSTFQLRRDANIILPCKNMGFFIVAGGMTTNGNGLSGTYYDLEKLLDVPKITDELFKWWKKDKNTLWVFDL